jgi:hypothetical protein
MSRLTVGQRIDLFLSNRRMRSLVMGMVLLGVGLLAGTMVPPPCAVWGEVMEPPPPNQFKSGDQLSVPILRDISATLHQIDGRLSRLEAVFRELSTPRPGATSGK